MAINSITDLMLSAKGVRLKRGLILAAGSLFFVSLHLCSAGLFAKTKRASINYAHYMMGIFYDRQNKLEEAIQEYKQALVVDNQSAQLHLRLGSAYLRKSEFSKAAGELRQVKVLDRDNLEAGLLLILIYASQDKSQEAAIEYEDVLKKAQAKDPKNTDVLKGLAALYYQRSNFDAAIKTYLLILEINKNNPETLFLLGSLFLEKGRRNDAIGRFKQALSINPEYAEALNSLGYLYAEDNRNLSEAEALVKKALAKDPDNAAYIDSLGWVYFKKNLLEDAIRELEKATSLLADATIFDHLGDAYYKKGLQDKALGAWQRSLELDPRQDKVKNKIEQLNKAKR